MNVATSDNCCTEQLIHHWTLSSPKKTMMTKNCGHLIFWDLKKNKEYISWSQGWSDLCICFGNWQGTKQRVWSITDRSMLASFFRILVLKIMMWHKSSQHEHNYRYHTSVRQKGCVTVEPLQLLNVHMLLIRISKLVEHAKICTQGGEEKKSTWWGCIDFVPMSLCYVNAEYFQSLVRQLVALYLQRIVSCWSHSASSDNLKVIIVVTEKSVTVCSSAIFCLHLKRPLQTIITKAGGVIFTKAKGVCRMAIRDYQLDNCLYTQLHKERLKLVFFI